MSIPQHLWLFMAWILFGFLHSFLASGKVKTRISFLLHEHFRYYKLGYSFFNAALLAFIAWYNFSITSIILWEITEFQKYFSGITGLAGLLIMLICIRKYFIDLSGIGVLLKRAPADHMQINGFNKYVRHPLYAATLLFTWSIFFWSPLLSNLISASCIHIYTLIGISFEEKKLIQFFGNAYAEYASVVPKLIPKLFTT